MITGSKKIIKTVLLTALVILIYGTSFAYAGSEILDSGTCGAVGNETNVMWTLDADGVLTISGTGAMKDFEYVNNQYYTSDSPWYSKRAEIKSIVIKNSVTSIGDRAFCGCTKVESVVIPNTVKSIGEESFYACIKLEGISIPVSVKSIGVRAFLECRGLTSITIPNDVTRIPGEAFEYCTSLKSVDLPNNLTSIGNSAFYFCTSLTDITIPDNVTSIEGGAFNTCIRLESINIPDGVTSLDSGVFSGCKALTSVTIPDSVTMIDNYAFKTCESLTYVLIPDSVESIGMQAFEGCSGLTSLLIPESVTSIGDNALNKCTKLANIYIVENSYSDTWLAESDFVSAAKHVYKSEDYYYYDVTTSLPGCVTAGSKNVTRLGKGTISTYQEDIPAPGHDYKFIEGSAVDATCTKTGSKKYICSVCEDEKTETIPATGHKEDLISSTDPTCTTAGEKNYKCSVCGNTRKEIIQATGHAWGEWTITEQPTCGAKGVKVRTCTNDPSHTETGEVAATGKHTWDGGTVTTAPTCTKNGVKTFTCTTCGSKKTSTISATGHAWGDWSVTTEPTCGAKGVETRVCASDPSHTETREVAATGNHTWDSGAVTTKATCESAGVKTYTCTVCSGKKTEPISATGHAWGDWTITTEPTCGAKGVETKVCANDPSHIDTREVAATGNHTWDNGTVTTKATCESAGVMTYTCTVCKGTKTEPISATGHNWGEWAVTTEPTCVDKGVETKVCANDPSHTETREVVATGIHKWDDGSITTEPTCETAGVRTYSCINCDETKTESVNALGHSYKVTVVEPTYEAGGYTLHECTRDGCGYSYRDNETDPLEVEPTVLDGGKCGTNAKWSYLDNGTLRIYGSGAMDDYSVIEISYASYETTAPWAAYRGNITKVIVENGITSLGACTLWESKVTRATLADSVQSIGEKAFFGCKDLTNISMPGIKTIGNSAFSYAEGLTALDLPEGLISLGKNAFSECKLLEVISIPSTVISIGSRAFDGCRKLLGTDGMIILPEGLTEIPDYSFYGCVSLEKIQVPVSVTAIGSYAFNNCPKLAYVYYGGSVPQFIKIDISTLGNSYFTKAQLVVSKKYDLAGSKLYLDRYSYDYTGAEIKPQVDVVCDGYEAVEDKDYTVEYADNIEIGKGTVTVTGKGNFEGTKSIEFGIYESTTNIEDCEINLASSSADYTGEEVEVPVTVKYNGKPLEAGKDYRVRYENNVEPGNAKATIEGIGTYYGKVTKEFTIVRVDYSLSLDMDRTIMCINTQMQLSASSAAPVTWRSSNPAVASVSSSGLVKAHSPGTANITVSNKRNSASCRISVSDYSYLAGTDCRQLQSRYNSRINWASVYAFTDALGSDVVITYVNYTIISNYMQFRIHNLSNGTASDDAISYYDNIVNRSSGAQKVRAMDARIQAQKAKIELLSGRGCGYSYKASGGGGTSAVATEPITISKTPSSVKAKAKKNKVTVSWKKIKKSKKTKVLLSQISSIEIQYASDPGFTQIVASKSAGKKKAKTTLKLARKTTYYVRVRYRGNGGVSNWSSIKRVKTK